MPWFRVDDNLGFHHKVIAAGNPAMGLWVRAGSVSASQLTDGFVPDHMVRSLGTVAQAKRLVEVGLWARVKGGYTFHEWDERQPRRADVEAERAAAKERMRAARERKRKAAQEASSQVSEERSENVRPNTSRSSGEVLGTFGNPYPTQPDPSRPDPPKEDVSEADASDAEPTSTLQLVADERSDVERICEHLAEQVEATGSKRPPVTQRWRTEARLMLDRDGRTEDQVHSCIRWLYTSAHPDAIFWRPNVRAIPKLRAEYDRLRQLAERTQAATGSTGRNAEWAAMQERQMARAIEREREMGLR